LYSIVFTFPLRRKFGPLMAPIRSLVAGVITTVLQFFRLFCSPIMWSAWAWVTTLMGLVCSWASQVTCFPSRIAPLFVIVAFKCVLLWVVWVRYLLVGVKIVFCCVFVCSLRCE